MPRWLFLSGFTTLLALLELLRDVVRLRTRQCLVAPQAVPNAGPLVSLLVPARDEELTLARCLDGALAQTYQRLEVLVLDDYSTDATPAILASYTAGGRVRAVQGRPLPAGWAGKCHACQQLAAAARGEWLLFIDADTVPQEGLVAALVAHMEHEHFDAFSLWPLLELGSFWERAVLPAFYTLIAAVYPAERLAALDARPDEVVANGQCLLVRRSAYAAIGGHGAVWAEVLEDVRLAQALRRAGYRVGMAHGPQLIWVRMYTSGREVFAGLTKNAAAGYRSGGLRSFGAAARMLFALAAPQWLLASGWLAYRRGKRRQGLLLLGEGGIVLGASLWAWGERLQLLYGLPRRVALLYPLGVVTYLAIALRAMWQVWRGHGVVWKGRRYRG